jgi:hypothetical protein
MGAACCSPLRLPSTLNQLLVCLFADHSLRNAYYMRGYGMGFGFFGGGGGGGGGGDDGGEASASIASPLSLHCHPCSVPS